MVYHVLIRKVNNLSKKYSYLFSADMVVTETENKLKHTIAYQEFQNIFETRRTKNQRRAYCCSVL